MSAFALFLIVTAWAVFLQGLLFKKKRLHPWFLPLYSVGVFILTILGFRNAQFPEALLNLISLILVAVAATQLNDISLGSKK